MQNVFSADICRQIPALIHIITIYCAPQKIMQIMTLNISYHCCKLINDKKFQKTKQMGLCDTTQVHLFDVEVLFYFKQAL